jgi:hypothetical protein
MDGEEYGECHRTAERRRKLPPGALHQNRHVSRNATARNVTMLPSALFGAMSLFEQERRAQAG